MQNLLNNIEQFDFQTSRIDSIKTIGEANDLAYKINTISILILNFISSEYSLNESDEPKVLSQNEAIIGGLLTRLDKFLLKFLKCYSENDLELLSIICRIIVETGINVIYLLDKNSDELYSEFIKYSHKSLVKSDKRSNHIPKSSRFSKTTKNHLKKSLEETEFKETDIDLSSRTDWSGKGGIYNRANSIGLKVLYDTIFAHTSHAIHGNWENIATFHLEKEPNGYKIFTGEVNITFDLLLGMSRTQFVFAQRLNSLILKPPMNNELINLIDKMLLKHQYLFLKTQFPTNR